MVLLQNTIASHSCFKACVPPQKDQSLALSLSPSSGIGHRPLAWSMRPRECVCLCVYACMLGHKDLLVIKTIHVALLWVCVCTFWSLRPSMLLLSWSCWPYWSKRPAHHVDLTWRSVLGDGLWESETPFLNWSDGCQIFGKVFQSINALFFNMGQTENFG